MLYLLFPRLFWLLGQQRRCVEICNALLHEHTTWKLTFVVATFEGGKAVEVIQCVFREKVHEKRGTDKQTNDEMPQEIEAIGTCSRNYL